MDYEAPPPRPSFREVATPNEGENIDGIFCTRRTEVEEMANAFRNQGYAGTNSVILRLVHTQQCAGLQLQKLFIVRREQVKFKGGPGLTEVLEISRTLGGEPTLFCFREVPGVEAKEQAQKTAVPVPARFVVPMKTESLQ